MPKTSKGKPQTVYHRDGSIWAKGRTANGIPTGYWEWFRKDGTMMRSGSFLNGAQTGEWTTYDSNVDVYKVTVIKAPKTVSAAKLIKSGQKKKKK